MQNGHNPPITLKSIPTTLVVESNLNNPIQGLRILSDSTDSHSIRRIELQTTATTNDRAGYKLAEREAHSWFFANYHPMFPEAHTEAYTLLTSTTTEVGLSSGRITEEWLASSHPVMKTPKGDFMFGHHTGINPSATNPAWIFAFEIIPIGDSLKAKPLRNPKQ